MLLKQPSHDIETGTNRALRTTIGRPGTWQIPGASLGAGARIAPGAPELSALLYRMRSRRPSSQMPPLGTVIPDHAAIDALTKWIEEDLR